MLMIVMVMLCGWGVRSTENELDSRCGTNGRTGRIQVTGPGPAIPDLTTSICETQTHVVVFSAELFKAIVSILKGTSDLLMCYLYTSHAPCYTRDLFRSIVM